MSLGRNISIGCMNCRGLGDKYKRIDIFNFMKAKCFDITVLIDTHCSEKDESKWKNEWGEKDALFASVSSDSRGIVVLFRDTFSYSINAVKKINDNDAILIDLSLDVMRVTLVAIYGPNKDSPDFFFNLQDEIASFNNTNVIICGDFNVVQDYSLDTYKYMGKNNTKSNEVLLNIMEDVGYEDIWRLNNPDRKKFTWKGPGGKRSRLDYFLISQNLVTLCSNVYIRPGYRSDHELICLDLELSSQKRGLGYWKFNNELLRDREYVNLVKNCIMENENRYAENIEQETNVENLKLTISDQLFFEVLKFEIRGLTISYCARRKKEENVREREIVEEIENIFDKPGDEDSSENIKKRKDLENELEIIRQNKVKSTIIKAKANWIENGEKCTKYFCNLENKKYTEKLMFKLIGDNGETITETEDIINEQKRFYEKLYSKKENVSKDNYNVFLDNNNPFFTKISDEDRSLCEEPITKAECLNYLKQMKNEKSPGLDGYTVEFYKFFWRDIGNYLFRSFSNSLEIGELSISQKQGIITLLPKLKKLKEFLKNWRPISLLNVDYKILSGLLSLRLKKVLNKVISKTQKGFLFGRDISECTRLIYDVLDEAKKKKITGILLKLDFEKAFDSVDHEFLNACIKHFGFGKKFLNYINILYRNAKSCVLYNGHFSQFFNIKSGVRQGDPISPYLFIIAVAVLAATIIFRPNIKGLSLNGTEYLMTQFADDLNLFLPEDACNLRNVLNLFNLYESCSGVGVNFEKTEAIWIGNKIGSTRELKTQKPLNWLKEPVFKILGIEYNLNNEDITSSNYEVKLDAIKNLLNTWNWRNLSICGKITVIKSLAIPMLVHLLRSLPCPDEDFFKRFDTIIFSFIWNHKPDKIKRSVLINEKELGGLNLTHLRSFSKSVKIFWVKKMLDNNYNDDWKNLIQKKMEKFGGNYFWYLHSESLKEFAEEFNPFWKNVIEIWAELNENYFTENENFLSMPLWYNPNIKIDNQKIFWKNFSTMGINFVNDLISEDGTFLSYDAFIIKYNIDIDFLNYAGLLDAIPREWKEHIIDYETKLEEINHFWISKIKNNIKYNKLAYQLISEKFRERPEKVEQKWKNILNISDDDLCEIYSVVHQSLSLNSTLKAFQFKILHRILATNRLLFKMNISAYDLCTFCMTHSESIEHLFWDCMDIKNIWFKLFDKLRLKDFLPNLKFDKKTILLGYTGDESINDIKCINLIIVIGKYYIYKEKLELKEPKFDNLFKYISYMTRIHTDINEKLHSPFMRLLVDP